MILRILSVVLVLHLLPAPAYAQMIPNLGGQRAGISSLQFMKIGVGGRGAALGEAMSAVADDASAMYWNPAGLTLNASNSVMAAHGEWLVGLKHDFVGLVYHLSDADVIGLSVISLATDDMEVTTELQPEGNGAYFKYSDLAVGISYGRKMTSQFAFGITVRYVQENLDVVRIRTMLFDLGTYYATGLGSLRIGVVVTNFGSDVSPEGNVQLISGTAIGDFQTFSPPTVFKFGVAMEPIETESIKFTTSLQLNHPNDNAENLRLGVEGTWENWLFLRAGVKRTIGEQLLGVDSKSSDDLSLGVGVKAPAGITDVSFDYAWTNFNQLGAVHRVSLAFTY